MSRSRPDGPVAAAVATRTNSITDSKPSSIGGCGGLAGIESEFEFGS
jgi:hypothetical protein